jgi:NADH:ubiquinone oxidoreductase subunit F (NADH-binding)
LGSAILGTSFSFTCDIRVGAGAFVSGEETALLASVEGRRGMPRNRPPFPSDKGLWNSPTCINNVETLANVPLILEKGEKWFRSFGTPDAPGTKVFALSGKIKNRGLIEVPMGTPIRRIIETMGDGSSSGKQIKAVQVGGLAGGIIPEEEFDLPLSYDSFQQAHSSIGSGGLIVLDEDDSVVDLTRFYTEFAVSESCGKCAPCRIGTTQLLHYLDIIRRGEGTEEDIDQLHRISAALRQASLCGLGRSAPNPFLSSYRHFPDEYTSLLRERTLSDD